MRNEIQLHPVVDMVKPDNERVKPFSITYLIAIGIPFYKVGTLKFLKYGDSSAIKVAYLLERQEGKAFDSVYSVVLCGNVNKSQVLDSIRKINSMLRPEDDLFVYFGGHSAVDYGGIAFLCPSDFTQGETEIDSHADCAISVEDLYGAIYRGNNKESNITVMLDVCNADWFGYPLELRAVKDNLNFSLISACLKNEDALEGDKVKGSAFVRALELIMENQYAGSCGDGTLKGIETDLKKLLPQVSLLLKGAIQNPRIVKNYPDERPVKFYLPEPSIKK